jgi:hypothetical protein
MTPFLRIANSREALSHLSTKPSKIGSGIRNDDFHGGSVYLFPGLFLIERDGV